MSAPEPISQLSGHMQPGRFGADGDTPVQLSERRVAIAQIMGRKGQDAALRAAISGALGLELPPPGGSSTNGSATAIWIAPETWLTLRDGSQGDDLVRDLTIRLRRYSLDRRSDLGQVRHPHFRSAGARRPRQGMPHRPASPRICARQKRGHAHRAHPRDSVANRCNADIRSDRAVDAGARLRRVAAPQRRRVRLRDRGVAGRLVPAALHELKSG